MDIEQFKRSAEEAGFHVMPDDEFEKWWEAKQEYHESPEGRAQEFETVSLLTYYLDNIAKYRWQEGMNEISGFGGGYEMACQAMLDSALQWLDEHPDADPHFKGYEGIYGILSEANEDAEALSEAALKASNGDATGAMHQAVMTHSLWINKNGWDAYVKAKSE